MFKNHLTKIIKERGKCVVLNCTIFILVGLPFNAFAEEVLLFQQINSWDVQSITVNDKNGNELAFDRKMCVWTFAPENSPTNEVRVTDFADQLLGLKYDVSLTKDLAQTGKSILGPKSFSYKIDIGLPDSKKTTLYLGTNGSSTIKYARLSSENETYLLTGKPLGEIVLDRNFWMPGENL